MAYSLIANTGTGSVDGNTVTTAGINTTGANLLVVVLSDFDDGTTTLQDSRTNTWTGLTARRAADGTRVRIYYVASPSVGAAHTFTATKDTNQTFPGLCVAAFSGGHTAPFDQQNGGTTAGATTLQTGSVTPSENNELLIAGISFFSSDPATINSAFNIANALDVDDFGGGSMGCALAYQIQTTATARNPTWTILTSAAAAAIATFKESAAGVAVRYSPRLTVMGVQ